MKTQRYSDAVDQVTHPKTKMADPMRPPQMLKATAVFLYLAFEVVYEESKISVTGCADYACMHCANRLP
jgi:hypothetical protein